MSDFFEEIDESEIVGRFREKREKLPAWVPILSWTRFDVPDEAWKARGYGWSKEDQEQVDIVCAERLAEQNEKMDKVIKVLNDRRIFVQTVRETKEVRIKL
jgi:hypothetical protein